MSTGTDEDVLPSVDRSLFRALMGSLMSGVSILTSRRADTSPVGMTCSSVCSVSADPPLLLACVATPSSTLDAITGSGRFVVNFLDSEADSVSDLFASRAAEKFTEVEWRPGAMTQAPVLAGSVAHAESVVHQLVEAGDHVIVVGRIVGGEALPDRFPLGYWRGSYARSLRKPRRTTARR
ncbi:flavin reductase family protein [Streptomyces sp. URMC 129]|uniref:flavin reductase family protein n=1 Tax=Streptomyces sp. URMC 129 TaxID=3423407 RepID=UPI003F1A0B59